MAADSGLHVQAVLVDMEEGVVSELLRGPLSEVFDHRQLITDVSGSGNNWSVVVPTFFFEGTECHVTAHFAFVRQGGRKQNVRKSVLGASVGDFKEGLRAMRLSPVFLPHPLAWWRSGVGGGVIFLYAAT